jgi:hypothetical protein
LVLLFAVQVHATRLPLLPKENYKWSAFLNTTTGLASSKESSIVPKSSNLARWIHSATTSQNSLLSQFEKTIQTYPQWLSRTPVTFGLLRAEAGPTTGAWRLRLRLVNLELLSFGPIRQSHGFSYRQDVSPEQSLQTSQCVVSLPITGGFLTTMNKNNHRNEQGPLILFTLRHSKTIHNDPTTATTTQHHNNATDTIQLQTALIHYRPTLVGSRLPVPDWRQRLYSSTQSFVHAHVMWRFHRYCWKHCCDENTKSMKEPSNQ